MSLFLLLLVIFIGTFINLAIGFDKMLPALAIFKSDYLLVYFLKGIVKCNICFSISFEIKYKSIM